MTGGLAAFAVSDLADLTPEGAGSIPETADHWVFYAGRDDIHGILATLLAAVSRSEVGNMFGYDDDQLNALVWQAVENPEITTFWTLDHSQAGSPHEKQILESDVTKDPAGFRAHFAIIETATGQISHTKGAVLDGLVAFEGSTNWSRSGEGVFVIPGKPGGPGYLSQNNTLAVFTDPATVTRFAAELQHEHAVARTFAAPS